MMATVKIGDRTRTAEAVDESANGSVDRSTCDYSLYGTSRRRDFIFSVH
ncbi:MAG TPA: hypothetical protein VHX17_05580 [Candidatus Cybelea sp.]|jgi:hypothetical protein|nr:hypothetical protein [Candidatus Cybelea sp.]